MKKNERKRLLLLLMTIVSVAFIGCNRCRQSKDSQENMSISRPQREKSWQILAAEKAIAQLKDVKTDAERLEIRDYIKAMLLLEKGGDPDRKFRNGNTLLVFAIIRRDIDVVMHLLSPHIFADVNSVNDFGDTPLIIASRQKDEKIVLALLENGALVDQRNTQGTTALMEGAKNGGRRKKKLAIRPAFA